MYLLEMFGLFMKNFRFHTMYLYILLHYLEATGTRDTICVCGFIRCCDKYHQLLSKVISINWNSHLDHLATAYSCPSPYDVFMCPRIYVF